MDALVAVLLPSLALEETWTPELQLRGHRCGVTSHDHRVLGSKGYLRLVTVVSWTS